MKTRLGLGLLLIAAGAGCAAPRHEARSLLGAPLERAELDEDFHAAQSQALAAAKRAYAQSPSEENGIWVGRHLGYLGRTREAVQHYTRMLQRFPDSYRVRRHRGHRFISLREFAKAEQDLDIAWGLCQRYPDCIEADGLPNEQGIPTGTDRSNILYHLALAEYLMGDFGKSLSNWQLALEALGTEPLVSTDDHRVAASYWHRLTSARTGVKSGFPAAMVRADDNVIENHAYHQLCLLLSGRLPRKDFQATSGDGTQDATRLYGLARWYAEQGRDLEARLLLEHIVRSTHWAAFGHIAAEADLARAQQEESPG